MNSLTFPSDGGWLVAYCLWAFWSF